MLFASTSLAARIERAECRLLADSAASAARRRPGHRRLRDAARRRHRHVHRAGSPLNKVAGLGFEGPLDEGELAAVERAFAERGVAVQAEVASLGDPAVVRRLTGRGYRLQGFENVLGRSLPAGPRRRCRRASRWRRARSRSSARGSTWW